MTYKDFTLEELATRFGVTNRIAHFFPEISLIEPSATLKDALEEARSQPVRSEKARSEWLVMPVLFELRKRNNRFFNIHSGEYLNVDREAGLYGEVDFMLGKNTGSYVIDTPIFSLVEAKKQDIDFGINQCAAQMVGAMKFNAVHGHQLPVIYGCVTTGDTWAFLRLSENLLEIDPTLHSISSPNLVLGILQHIIDYYKATLQ